MGYILFDWLKCVSLQYAFIILGCTNADGTAGDATLQGTCHTGALCESSGKCIGRCYALIVIYAAGVNALLQLYR